MAYHHLHRCLTLLFSCGLFAAPLCLANSETIKPFTSDGCSVFPDGTLEHKNLWLSCCTTHDFAYWQGGTFEERLAADKALEAGVTQVGEPRIAQIMLVGVRVGGTPYLPTAFRWGYGWPYPRLYKALSEDEHCQVQQNINFTLFNLKPSKILD